MGLRKEEHCFDLLNIRVILEFKIDEIIISKIYGQRPILWTLYTCSASLD